MSWISTGLQAGEPSAVARRWWMAAVLAVAFAVRSLYAVDLAPTMYSRLQEGTRMAAHYDESAVAILHGEGILFPSRPDPADTGRLARPPGYPAFLAAVYGLLGRSFFAAQLVQNLLGAATCVAALLLGARLLGWRAGLVGGLAAALAPQTAFASNLLLADALCPLPLVLALLLLAVDDDPPSRFHLARAVAAGLLIGAATWLRPNTLLLGFFLAPFLLARAPRMREGVRQAVVVAAAAVLVVAPITLRNWLVYHELVPVSINGGISLLHGVAQAGAQRFGIRSRDKLSMEEEAAYHGDPRLAEWWAAPDGIRRDRERYREAWRVIAAHPLWYGRAMLGRMRSMVAYWEGGAPLVMVRRVEGAPAASRTLVPGRAMSWLRPAVWTAQSALCLVLFPLTAAGAIVTWAVRRRAAWLLLALPIYYLLFESMFLYEWRVAVPMHYPLFILAGAGAALAPAALRRALSRGRRAQNAAG